MNRMVMVMAVGIILALPLFGGVEGSWSGTVEGMSFPLDYAAVPWLGSAE